MRNLIRQIFSFVTKEMLENHSSEEEEGGEEMESNYNNNSTLVDSSYYYQKDGLLDTITSEQERKRIVNFPKYTCFILATINADHRMEVHGPFKSEEEAVQKYEELTDAISQQSGKRDYLHSEVGPIGEDFHNWKFKVLSAWKRTRKRTKKLLEQQNKDIENASYTTQPLPLSHCQTTTSTTTSEPLVVDNQEHVNKESIVQATEENVGRDTPSK